MLLSKLVKWFVQDTVYAGCGCSKCVPSYLVYVFNPETVLVKKKQEPRSGHNASVSWNMELFSIYWYSSICLNIPANVVIAYLIDYWVCRLDQWPECDQWPIAPMPTLQLWDWII